MQRVAKRETQLKAVAGAEERMARAQGAVVAAADAEVVEVVRGAMVDRALRLRSSTRR